MWKLYEIQISVSIKFCGSTVPLICSCTVNGNFHTARSSCVVVTETVWPARLKYLLFGSFQKLLLMRLLTFICSRHYPKSLAYIYVIYFSQNPVR